VPHRDLSLHGVGLGLDLTAKGVGIDHMHPSCRKCQGRSCQGNRLKEESSSFLKKRTKKLLLIGARLRPERGSKSFLLLFFKKEDLSIACLPSPDCRAARAEH
jgi:hypothetical protein